MPAILLPAIAGYSCSRATTQAASKRSGSCSAQSNGKRETVASWLMETALSNTPDWVIATADTLVVPTSSPITTQEEFIWWVIMRCSAREKLITVRYFKALNPGKNGKPQHACLQCRRVSFFVLHRFGLTAETSFSDGNVCQAGFLNAMPPESAVKILHFRWLILGHDQDW